MLISVYWDINLKGNRFDRGDIVIDYLNLSLFIKIKRN